MNPWKCEPFRWVCSSPGARADTLPCAPGRGVGPVGLWEQLCPHVEGQAGSAICAGSVLTRCCCVMQPAPALGGKFILRSSVE